MAPEANQLLVLLGVYFISIDVFGECEDPPIIENASGSSGSPPYMEGTEVKYKCKVGFSSTGSAIFICNQGSWKQGSLQCTQTYCPKLSPPENGYILNDPIDVPGSYTTFACKKAYDIIGDSTLYCTTKLQWTPLDLPICKLKRCPNLPHIDNGELFYLSSEENVPGSVLAVRCNSGYVVHGKNKINCQEDWTWEDFPICISTDCGSYPGLDYSSVKYSFMGERTLFVEYEDNATVQGKSDGSFTCNSATGKWDPPEIIYKQSCLIKKGPGVVVDGVNNDKYVAHGDVLQWSCSFGMKSTNDPLRCLEGNINQPKCIVTHSDGSCPEVTSETSASDSQKINITCSVKTNIAKLQRYSIAWYKDDNVVAEMDGNFSLINVTNDYDAEIMERGDNVELTLKIPLNMINSFKCILKNSSGNLCERDAEETEQVSSSNNNTVIMVASFVAAGIAFFFLVALFIWFARRVDFRKRQPKASDGPTSTELDDLLRQPVTTRGRNDDRIITRTEEISGSLKSEDGTKEHGEAVSCNVIDSQDSTKIDSDSTAEARGETSNTKSMIQETHDEEVDEEVDWNNRGKKIQSFIDIEDIP